MGAKEEPCEDGRLNQTMEPKLKSVVAAGLGHGMGVRVGHGK